MDKAVSDKQYKYIVQLMIVAVAFSVAATVFIAAYAAYTLHKAATIEHRIRKLTDSGRITALLASGARGFTQGIGRAITSAMGKGQDLPPPIKGLTATLHDRMKDRHSSKPEKQ